MEEKILARNLTGICKKMIEALVQSSPDLNSHSRFVLCPPDFDSYNILVDPNLGNVNGFIDWDLAQTMPPHIGYRNE